MAVWAVCIVCIVCIICIVCSSCLPGFLRLRNNCKPDTLVSTTYAPLDQAAPLFLSLLLNCISKAVDPD